MPNILLIGAGKMGGAMLRSWSAASENKIIVLDPGETDAIKVAKKSGAQHFTQISDLTSNINTDELDIIVLAVKPQLFKSVIHDIAPNMPDKALIISVLAGTSLKSLGAHFSQNPIIRAMPNSPASIGKGITAITGNTHVTPQDIKTASLLLSPCGPVRHVQTEELIDVVTAISGSGPAYIFHFVEGLATSGEKLGLSSEDAKIFARQMVIGAGALLEASDETATQLRKNVTSPNGTTQAALEILMHEGGLSPLLDKATQAAYKRAQALSRE